jgi:DNA-binding MarR family transcriptional regulator
MIRLADFLPYRLSVASNSVSRRIAGIYEERFRLSVPEWRLVAILAEAERATPLVVARLAEMDKISVSRAAKGLIARGLVRALAHPTDRRSHFLQLTDSGWSLYEEVAPLALELQDELLASFTADEVAELKRLLVKIQAAAGATAPDREARSPAILPLAESSDA